MVGLFGTLGLLEQNKRWDAEEDDSTLENSPAQMGSAIFIQVDKKKNPVFVPVSGTILAIHILPFHANVWLISGEILEMPVHLARKFSIGETINVLGSPIWVEGNPPGNLWVNCKLA